MHGTSGKNLLKLQRKAENVDEKLTARTLYFMMWNTLCKGDIYKVTQI
jgi:hypothetical protein